MNKLIAFTAGLLLSFTAVASTPELPAETEPYSIIYQDDVAVVALFPGTKKVDEQGHPSALIATVLNPKVVEETHQKVAAVVGRVVFDCKNQVFQIMTDFLLNTDGDVIGEKTDAEMTGWKGYTGEHDVIIGKIAFLVCGKEIGT